MVKAFKTILSILTLTLIMIVSSCQKDNGSKVEELKPVDDVCTEMDDLTFMKYCYDNYDVNKDGKVSMSEAEAVKSIDISDKKITSLKGIRYFKNITELRCWNSLSELDVSGCASLTLLNCGGCGLTSLNVNGCSALSKLYCDANKLNLLDVRSCASLSVLECTSNNLSNLNVSGCAELSELICEYNNLTSLNLSGCANLIRLNCANNVLNILDVSHSLILETLLCRKNHLTAIELSDNMALGYLNCGDNTLKMLDLSNNSSLWGAFCNNNPELAEIWLKEGTEFVKYKLFDDYSGKLLIDYDSDITTIKYK